MKGKKMMEKKDTKQIILDEALSLFAVRGFDGVTVADIADSVGIKASSLYKHYASKQDIFDSILVRSAARYKEMSGSLGIDGNIPEKDVGAYSGMDADTLVRTGLELFLYFLHDDYARKLRHMFTIEQYKNPLSARIYMEQYIDAPIAYQSILFEAFMEQGMMKKCAARTVALNFYAPIFLMLCLCDNSPEREPEASEMIRSHIMQFHRLYMVGEKS